MPQRLSPDGMPQCSVTRMPDGLPSGDCSPVQGCRAGRAAAGSVHLLGNSMAIQNPPVSQTRSFSTVFLIEMWERFGFYGMQVLMVTYMMKKLGFADVDANLVWGAASALIY